MIKNLHITNFKSHKETSIELRPLTLLTGLNGCGKSSILQALLLLRQSYYKTLLDKGLDLNMPQVKTGIADDVLYKLASTPQINIRLDYCGNTERVFDDFTFVIKDDKFKDSFIPLASCLSEFGNSFSADLLNKVPLFNNNFQYISALRVGGSSIYPKDSYNVDILNQISSELGKGDLVANYLYRYGSNPTFNYLNDNGDFTLIDQVIAWERIISPDITINIQPFSDNTNFVILYGYDAKDGYKPLKDLRAENIGFGISYTLPVIVALLSAEPGSLLLIENPEAHLHPEGQREIGRLIALVAQRGIQVIVETHSDHIINAAMEACKRRIPEKGGLDKNNVIIHYFGNKDENHSSKLETIFINENGNLNYQPKGFFDTIESSLDFLNTPLQYD